MRLALAAVFLLVAFAEARQRLPCPVPQYHRFVNAWVCRKYTSCEWVDSECLLKDQEDIGYITDAVEESPGKSTFYLKRDSEFTLFNGDIKNLVAEFYMYDNYHARVRITDRDSERYEVPVSLNLPEETKSPENPLFEVVVADSNEGSESLFDFKVVRASTGTVIFDTASVSGFVYEDQFLQIATALPSSYVYGMGENVHESFRLPFDNVTYNIFAKDQMTQDGVYGTYGTHPVYHCIEDDEGNSHAVFFFNSNAMEYSLRELPDGSPGIIFRSVGGILDIHFLMGPRPEDLIQQYTKLVGFPMMPPYWGLGFQLSRYGYMNIENMQAAVNRTIEAKIPYDVQYLDIDHYEKRKDFTYDKETFHGLPEYLEYLRSMNIRFIPIVDPALACELDKYSPFMRGRKDDVFVSWPSKADVPRKQPSLAKDYVVGVVWPEESKTVFPDFMYQPTHDWWVNEHKIWRETIPFDGLWIDMNEPTNFGTNERHPEDGFELVCKGNKYDEPPYPTTLITLTDNPSRSFADKTICMNSQHKVVDGFGIKRYNHYDVHTLYGLSESIATYRANYETTGLRPLVIGRSTFPSSGKYAGHWLGDNFSNWNNMRRSIIGMFEFNMFAIPFNGADICGFNTNATEELCSRWMALGAFYPFARNHNERITNPQDPGFWESTAAASRKSLGARYHMLPYLYTLLYSAHTEGHSVVRPLLNEFPADLTARDVDDVLLWGSYVLVAPIMEEGATSRKVYFPDALWYNYWDRKLAVDRAGINLLVADITTIGVYIRGGAIIPTKHEEVNTELQRKNPFGLLVALDSNGEASGELYWDDGITEGAIESGQYHYSTYTFKKVEGESFNELKMTVTQKLDLGDELKLHDIEILGYPEEPIGVTAETEVVLFDYDEDTKVLTIHLQHDMNRDLRVLITTHNNMYTTINYF